MKRRDILKALEKAGLELREGGNHTKVYKDGVYVSAISRQREIAESVVRAIEKQTGIKLR
jgi:predicted RNA binding protein YcfA (HicA-like mRNA interferase family)